MYRMQYYYNYYNIYLITFICIISNRCLSIQFHILFNKLTIYQYNVNVINLHGIINN